MGNFRNSARVNGGKISSPKRSSFIHLSLFHGVSWTGLHEHQFNHQLINSSGIFRICGLGKDLSLSPGGIGFIFFPSFLSELTLSNVGLGFTVV